MVKKERKISSHKIIHTPGRLEALLNSKRTPGQYLSDSIAKHIGSWSFILFFLLFMTIWILLNVYAMIQHWDPYPFILLNFVLSTIAALQGPIILMSQNREAERDRQNFKYDYAVNKKAEHEIQKVLRELDSIKRHVYKHLGNEKKK